MRAQFNRAHTVDTDEIHTVVPDAREPRRNPQDEDTSSNSTPEPEYESPLTTVAGTLPRSDKVQAHSESGTKGGRGPRASVNYIYRTCGENETANAHSGYNYVTNTRDDISLASTATEHTSSTAPQYALCWANPTAIIDDSADYAEIPLRQERPSVGGRSRQNEVYSWGTCSGAKVFNGINEGNREIPRSRKPKRRKCQSFSLLTFAVAFCALFLAGWAFMRTTKDHGSFKEANKETSQELSTRDKPKNESTNQTSPNQEEGGPESGGPESEDSYKSISNQISALNRTYSKLLQKFNSMKKQTQGLATLDASLNNIKMKVEHSDLSFKKANISIWEKLNKLRGPRGYNGTKGDRGPSGLQGPPGPPGPRGLSVTNCTYTNTSKDGGDPEITVSKEDTKKEKLFDVSCDSTISQLKPHYQQKGKKYTCRCINKEINPMKFTCTIKYVLCQLP